MTNRIYAIDVHKYGERETLKIIHIIAQQQLQASHIAHAVVYEIGMFDNIPVEIYSVTKVPDIENVVNADELFENMVEEGNDNDPFETEGIPADDLIHFKHICDATITVTDSEWETIECPTCKERIDRKEVQNLNGIWCFIPNKKGRNPKRK
jgi:hypothetical protein